MLFASKWQLSRDESPILFMTIQFHWFNLTVWKAFLQSLKNHRVFIKGLFSHVFQMTVNIVAASWCNPRVLLGWWQGDNAIRLGLLKKRPSWQNNLCHLVALNSLLQRWEMSGKSSLLVGWDAARQQLRGDEPLPRLPGLPSPLGTKIGQPAFTSQGLNGGITARLCWQWGVWVRSDSTRQPRRRRRHYVRHVWVNSGSGQQGFECGMCLFTAKWAAAA